MLIFGGKAYGVPRLPPLAYALYAFINVDNCERPLIVIVYKVEDNLVMPSVLHDAL